MDLHSQLHSKSNSGENLKADRTGEVNEHGMHPLATVGLSLAVGACVAALAPKQLVPSFFTAKKFLNLGSNATTSTPSQEKSATGSLPGGGSSWQTAVAGLVISVLGEIFKQKLERNHNTRAKNSNAGADAAGFIRTSEGSVHQDTGDTVRH